MIDVGAYGGIVITPGADVVYLVNTASGTLVADDYAFVRCHGTMAAGTAVAEISRQYWDLFLKLNSVQQ